jgi:uncharacterized repeat protein (TIGR01451 family)
LTNITISPDLNCNVSHDGDSAPEFYGATACGTFLATGTDVYGPESVPAGIGGHPAFTPVSQTSNGTGSAADPYVVTTVVDLGTSGMRITQKDSYVVGQESYRTDTTVANNGSAAINAVLYKAADCYLQDSDSGFGAYDASTGAISCVAANADGTGPGTRIEQFYPLSAGSSYYEAFYSSVWQAVDTGQPLPNTCEQCANNVDNGAGLSWSLVIAAGASVTRSHLTTFSPLGVQPLTTTKTADAGTAAAGTSDGYTVKIHNGNLTAQTVTSITDSLPAGFSYAAGSATGATTADPTVSGQNLTWTGSFPVAAGADLTLHFGVTVSTTPGTYYNNASGTATDLAVAPTGDTAPVTVTAVNHAPVANDQSVTTPQDTAKAITLTGSDPDHDAITYTVGTGPSHGTLSGTAPNLTYTPTAGYTGPDSFTFTTNDGTLTSAPGTVSITVTAVSTGCTVTSPSVDTRVSARNTTASSTLQTSHVSTSHGNELILAFIEADGPAQAGGQRVTSVTGGGLTWTRAARSNATWGTAEVWQAYATTALSDVTIKAHLAAAYDGAITVTAFDHAATHVGATATAGGTRGIPSATIQPSSCGSLIWGAGHDWSGSRAAVPGPGQSFVDYFRDRRVHDTYWTMKLGSPVTTTDPVTLSVGGITLDRWQLVAVEIPGIS